MSSPSAPARDRATFAAFLATATLAGGNGVAIRFSNRELAPIWGATLRFLLAAMVLAVIFSFSRKPLPRGWTLGGVALFGLFQFAGAFGFAYYALVRIQAGFGQTLLALTPLLTLFLAVALGQERLRPSAMAGAVLGGAGVYVASSGSVGSDIPLLPFLAVFASAVCMAAANVTVRSLPGVHPITLNTVGMPFGVVVLFALSRAAGEPVALPDLGETWAALIYVSLVGSIVVFVLLAFVIQRWTASRASYVMVIIPVVTILLSAWLDDERIGGGLVVGGLLIVSGVYFGALRQRP